MWLKLFVDVCLVVEREERSSRSTVSTTGGIADDFGRCRLCFHSFVAEVAEGVIKPRSFGLAADMNPADLNPDGCICGMADLTTFWHPARCIFIDHLQALGPWEVIKFVFATEVVLGQSALEIRKIQGVCCEDVQSLGTEEGRSTPLPHFLLVEVAYRVTRWQHHVVHVPRYEAH